MSKPTKRQALSMASYFVNDALSEMKASEVPADLSRVQFVAFPAGFEPLVVAVWSYMDGVKVDADEAIEIAADLLLEKGWLQSADDAAADNAYVI